MNLHKTGRKYEHSPDPAGMMNSVVAIIKMEATLWCMSWALELNYCRQVRGHMLWCWATQLNFNKHAMLQENKREPSDRDEDNDKSTAVAFDMWAKYTIYW